MQTYYLYSDHQNDQAASIANAVTTIHRDGAETIIKQLQKLLKLDATN